MTLESPRPFAPSRAAVTTVPKWQLPAVVAGIVLPPFLPSLAGSLLHSLWGLAAYLAMLALVSVMTLWTLRQRVRREGELSVTNQEVLLEGRSLVRIDRILWTALDATDSGARLCVQPRGMRSAILVDVDSAETGRALLWAASNGHVEETRRFLATLGGRAQQRRQRQVGPLAALVPLVAIGVLFAAKHGALSAAVALSAALVALAIALRRTPWQDIQIGLGTDGVVLREIRRKRPARFVPYGEIVSHELDGDDLVLGLRGVGGAGGETLRVCVVLTPFKNDADRAEAAKALYESFVRARGNGTNVDAPSPETLARLDPGEKDALAWQASLDHVLNAPATYRSSAVDNADLWRILEDPTQPLALRGGAAVALRQGLDEAGALRLRVAAANSASQGLKRVVVAAATGEEDDLVAALDDISPARELRSAGRS